MLAALAELSAALGIIVEYGEDHVRLENIVVSTVYYPTGICFCRLVLDGKIKDTVKFAIEH